MLKLVAFVFLVYAFEGLSQPNKSQRQLKSFPKPSPAKQAPASVQSPEEQSPIQSPLRSPASAHISPPDIIGFLQQESKALSQRKRDRLIILSQERDQLRRRLDEASDRGERREIKRLLREKFKEIVSLQTDSEIHREDRALGRELLKLKNKRGEWSYKNCEESGEGPFTELESDTEAEFCPECRTQISNLISSFHEVQNFRHTQAEQQWPEFKERLRKRALGLVSARQSHIQFMKACVTGDEDKIEEWSEKIKALIPEAHLPHQGRSDGKSICEAEVKKLKDSIKENFKSMKISLALSSADRAVSEAQESVRQALPANMQISDPSRNLVPSIEPSDFRAYMDTTPSHPFWDFNSLPSLSQEEQEEAREKHISQLFDELQTWDDSGNLRSWKDLNREKFKELVLEGKIHPGFVSTVGNTRGGDTDLSLSQEDRNDLKAALEAVAKANLFYYSEDLTKHPILGWVKDEDPSSMELAEALSEMENRVAKFAEELKGEPSDGFLLSFQALTEDLLKDTAEGEDQASPFCLAVEKARLKAEEEEGGISTGLLLATGAAILPCLFVAASPALALGVACLAAGLGLSVYDLQESDSHVQRSLGHLFFREKIWSGLET